MANGQLTLNEVSCVSCFADVLLVAVICAWLIIVLFQAWLLGNCGACKVFIVMHSITPSCLQARYLHATHSRAASLHERELTCS